jgi:Polyketide cyclase / dehydrase and lipid transport
LFVAGNRLCDDASMTTVQLGADVLIDRPVGEVRAFFADVDNLARWDRGVVKVLRPTAGPLALGVEFATLGPARPGRQGKVSTYRITEIDDDHATVALAGDDIFEAAHWTTHFTPSAGGAGTTVRVDVVARARPRFFFVAWLLRLLQRSVADDLYYLKRAIEHGEIAKR